MSLCVCVYQQEHLIDYLKKKKRKCVLFDEETYFTSVTFRTINSISLTPHKTKYMYQDPKLSIVKYKQQNQSAEQFYNINLNQKSSITKQVKLVSSTI